MHADYKVILHCDCVPCHILCAPVSVLMVPGLCSDASSHTPGRQRQCCVLPDSPAASQPQRSSCSRQSRKQNTAAAAPVPTGSDSWDSHSQECKGEKWLHLNVLCQHFLLTSCHCDQRQWFEQVSSIFILYLLFSFARWLFQDDMTYKSKHDFF